MRNVVVASILVFLATSFGFAKVVVFWRDGFPTVASQPVAHKTLAQALDRTDPVFTNIVFTDIDGRLLPGSTQREAILRTLRPGPCGHARDRGKRHRSGIVRLDSINPRYP